MDVFVAGPTPTGLTLDARAGGSPFNMALGLARLGQPAALLAGLSTDALGERLAQALQAEGVHTGWLQRNAQPTTLSMVSLTADGQPRYAFHGAQGADRQLALPPELPPCIQLLQLGSYALVVEPCAGSLRALVAREQGRRLIAYDPNVRLNVQPDPGAWRGALAWMLPRCGLLKISAEDLALLHGDRSAEAFAAQALGAGVQLVIVTAGAEGARAWHAQSGEVAVPAPAVSVVDTVGAGDSFQAALLAWLAEHDRLSLALSAAELQQALAFAARAAALTCSRQGADLPRRAALD